MRRLLGCVVVLSVVAVSLVWAAPAHGQETPEAKATRKRLQEPLTVEIKETPLKEALDELKREMNNKISFKIDNVSGISNNSKVTIVAKDQPLEKILNDLCDKYDYGYIVQSNAKERTNGWIILRKSKDKERGYEAGKEPKKDKSSLLPPDQRFLLVLGRFSEELVVGRP